MAELKVYADQCTIGGGVIHLGATSMDIEDNADALRLRDALGLVHAQLCALLKTLAEQITLWADHPCVGFTHLQPAEPTTIGYRLAQYGQDLLDRSGRGSIACAAEFARQRDQGRGGYIGLLRTIVGRARR